MNRSQPHESPSKAGHTHRHGVIDPKIAETQRGKRAVKWSFAVLMLTALLQVIVVARLRIRVGREINSAALEADGRHARIDGPTSLSNPQL